MSVGRLQFTRERSAFRLPRRFFLFRSFSIASSVFLGSFLITLFSSLSFTPVTDGDAATRDPVAGSDYTTLSLSIQDPTTGSSLSSISLTARPGTFSSETVNLVATTDNSSGFTLSLANQDTDSALYLDGDIDSEYKIETLAENTTKTAFPNDTYGYSLDDTTFRPVPTSASPALLTSTTSSGSSTTAFTLGAKLTSDIPSGTYTDTVVFTLVANAIRCLAQ